MHSVSLGEARDHADAVPYTHVRAHETKANLVCCVLPEKDRGFAVCDDYEKIRDLKSMLNANADLSTRSYIFPVSPVKFFFPCLLLTFPSPRL